jgi:cytoplasmic iron level regulating protein YaaA (DUF328/UPF0246 family)
MKIIFSPTKSQKLPHEIKKISSGVQTFFPKKTKKLIQLLKKYSLSDIQKTFKISDSKAQQTFEDIKNFSQLGIIKAKYLFTGTAFKELMLSGYTTKQTKYFTQHLRILSALYGVLEPDNFVYPYRLDMNDKIMTKKLSYKNLYDYWRDDISNYFLENEIIINLASNEYSKILNFSHRSTIIDIHFLVQNKGREKSISIYVKQQRGKMFNYMVKNNIENPLLLKKYSLDGFVFDPQRSDKYNYYFIKNHN